MGTQAVVGAAAESQYTDVAGPKVVDVILLTVCATVVADESGGLAAGPKSRRVRGNIPPLRDPLVGNETLSETNPDETA